MCGVAGGDSMRVVVALEEGSSRTNYFALITRKEKSALLKMPDNR
jgi:hypothetical protein